MVALAAVAIVVAPARGSHAAARAACGLPDATPLWLDYAEGSVDFRQELFGRPGIVAATSGSGVPAALRATGAQTVYWWGRLGSLVGTTTKPADPATIAEQAGKLVERAIASSGCQTPLIVLNELNGPGTTTPWTPNNAQYRANVLALLQAIAARSARPLLLVPSAPYTGGEALTWWQQVAQVSDIVPEVYFNAPKIMRLGVILGSRRMRQAYRQAIDDFTSIGVPVSKLGLVIGFQSGPGAGGREGLQPSSAWFRFVKLQTLAAKQVAKELGLATVISWGWGTFSEAGADPDKAAAACVYLWARSPSLCNGPEAAGAGFDASLTEGQIQLGRGVRCVLDGKSVTTDAIARATRVTHDAGVALTALFERLIESERATIPPERVLAAEQTLVALRYGGNRSAYLAAIKQAGATLAAARSVIADGLRRAEIARRLTVPAPTQAQITAFYDTYPGVSVRLVRAQPAPDWLGGRRQGFVVFPPGPAQLLLLTTGQPTTVITSAGSFQVTALEGTLPLGAVPLATVAPALRTALLSYARDDAFDSWIVAAEERALKRILCTRDALPAIASVDLASYLPFLAMDS